MTQAARHRVGRTEADPADLVHEAKRILSNRRHHAVAVLLLNAERARATKAGRGQKDHQVANGALRLPARFDLLERLPPDSGNLTKALRLLVNDPKKLGAEVTVEEDGRTLKRHLVCRVRFSGRIQRRRLKRTLR